MDFWNKAVEVVEQRDQWRAAGDWLSTRIQNSEIHEAGSLLERVPWGLRLWSLAGNDKETISLGSFQTNGLENNTSILSLRT